MMIDAFLCWIEHNPGLASWVQAIGTLIALAIAICVPLRLHIKERQERERDKRLQAQGVSLLIRGPLIVLDGDIERELQAFEKKGYNPGFSNSIKVPDLIMGQINRLWLMGEPGEHILHLIATIESDAHLMKSFGPLSKLASEADIAIEIDLRKKRLQFARADAADADAGIKALLDVKP